VSPSQLEVEKPFQKEAKRSQSNIKKSPSKLLPSLQLNEKNELDIV
jgi:hypothetical protein